MWACPSGRGGELRLPHGTVCIPGPVLSRPRVFTHLCHMSFTARQEVGEAVTPLQLRREKPSTETGRNFPEDVLSRRTGHLCSSAAALGCL